MAQSVGTDEASACDPIDGNPRFHWGEVNTVIAMIRQKNACARHACSVEIGAGKRNRTVMPPNTPLRITALSAAALSYRNEARFSLSQVQTVRMTVSRPTNDATIRWLCS